MIPYAFHPEAAAEFEEASAFYEVRMVGLGKSFAAEVERAVSHIREFPDAGSPGGISIRGALIPRFPYSLVYRVVGDAVQIVAVSHHRRRPGYWRHRTE